MHANPSITTITLVALVAAASCFDADPQAGLPCGPGDRCPPGQSCNDGVCTIGDAATPTGDGAGGGDADPGTDGPTSAELPAGTVLGFNLTRCPEGWSELVAAQGRALAIKQPGATAGATVGAALGDLGTVSITTPAQHSHAANAAAMTSSTGHDHTMGSQSNFDGTGTGSGPRVQEVDDWDTTIQINAATHDHAFTIPSFSSGSTGAGSVDVTMPYLQLLVCVKQ